MSVDVVQFSVMLVIVFELLERVGVVGAWPSVVLTTNPVLALEMLPVALFALVAAAVALVAYRRRID